MILTKRFVSLAAGMVLTLGGATAIARAQETPASPEPTPAQAASSAPTLMDTQYDGHTHIMVAPYIWGPTVKGDFQYSIPTLARKRGEVGITQSSVQIGPSDYLPKINSALMLAFDARKGDVDLFGDIIYLNASTSAAFSGSISGPLGKVQVPISLNTNARLAVAIWEAAAGLTFAHGHNADLSGFVGVRDFPLTLSLDYNAVVGKRGIIQPSGTVMTSDSSNDVIFGLRGKAFFGDDHLFVPYYADFGFGAIDQTWEAYTGAGYAFNHGQTLLVAWRALNYNAFPPGFHVQKLTLGGPLLGYTFNL